MLKKGFFPLIVKGGPAMKTLGTDEGIFIYEYQLCYGRTECTFKPYMYTRSLQRRWLMLSDCISDAELSLFICVFLYSLLNTILSISYTLLSIPCLTAAVAVIVASNYTSHFLAEIYISNLKKINNWQCYSGNGNHALPHCVWSVVALSLHHLSSNQASLGCSSTFYPSYHNIP